jgi:hypothetical protein
VEKNRDVEAEKDCKAGKDADAVAPEAPQTSSPENLPTPPIVEGCSPTCTLLIAIAITRRGKKKPLISTTHQQFSVQARSKAGTSSTKPKTPKKQETSKESKSKSKEEGEASFRVSRMR